MTSKPIKAPVKLRALTDLSLRKTPESEEWLEWKAGQVFTPPAHMDVRKALKRGIVEEVKDG